MPTQVCYQDAEHLERPGIWAGAGHPGGRMRRIRRDVIHRDKGLYDGVLLEPD